MKTAQSARHDFTHRHAAGSYGQDAVLAWLLANGGSVSVVDGECVNFRIHSSSLHAVNGKSVDSQTRGAIYRHDPTAQRKATLRCTHVKACLVQRCC